MTESDFYYTKLSQKNQEMVDRIYTDYFDDKWLYSKEENIFFNKLKNKHDNYATFYVDAYLLVFNSQWFVIHAIKTSGESASVFLIKVINVYSIGEFDDEIVPVIKLCLKAYLKYYFDGIEAIHYSVDVLTREYAKMEYAFQTNLYNLNDEDIPDIKVINIHKLKPYENCVYDVPDKKKKKRLLGYEVNNIQDERMIYKKRKKEKMVTELLFMLAFIVLIFILVFFIKSTETSYYVVPAMLLIRIATDAGGRAGNKKR